MVVEALVASCGTHRPFSGRRRDSRGDRDSIGDFGVGLNAGQVQASDHNHLLAIEEELGQPAAWHGQAAYKGWRQ